MVGTGASAVEVAQHMGARGFGPRKIRKIEGDACTSNGDSGNASQQINGISVAQR